MCTSRKSSVLSIVHNGVTQHGNSFALPVRPVRGRSVPAGRELPACGPGVAPRTGPASAGELPAQRGLRRTHSLRSCPTSRRGFAGSTSAGPLGSNRDDSCGPTLGPAVSVPPGPPPLVTQPVTITVSTPLPTSQGARPVPKTYTSSVDSSTCSTCQWTMGWTSTRVCFIAPPKAR